MVLLFIDLNFSEHDSNHDFLNFCFLQKDLNNSNKYWFLIINDLGCDFLRCLGLVSLGRNKVSVFWKGKFL